MTLPLTALHTLTLVACDAAYYGPIEGEVSRQAAEALRAREWGRLGGQAGKGQAKRHPQYGEKNGSAVLTERAVRTIRDLARRGYNCTLIAERCNVHRTTVADVLNSKSWGHVE